VASPDSPTSSARGVRRSIDTSACGLPSLPVRAAGPAETAAAAGAFDARAAGSAISADGELSPNSTSAPAAASAIPIAI
jgi:hypothetical protein